MSPLSAFGWSLGSASGRKAAIGQRISALATGVAALFCSACEASPVIDPAVGDGGLTEFYIWTEDAALSQGQMLRFEPLEPDLSLDAAGAAYRILYGSSAETSEAAEPVIVSGALFIPKGDPPPEGWPLIAWAHGTTGIGDICAPSANPRSARDTSYLSAWLRAGYAIVATDYPGLGTPGIHPYSNYRSVSYSVLDSERSVLDGDFPIANDVTLVGHSQGAGVALSTAGYWPDYASELHVSGVVLTGSPNLSRAAIESGLAWSAVDAMVTGAYAMIGFELGHLHDELTPESVFTDAGRVLHDKVPDACLPELMSFAADQGLTPSNMFKPGMLERLWATDVGLRAYPGLKIDIPVFLGIGLDDTAALPMTTLGLAVQLCKSGTRTKIRAYPGKDHISVVPAASEDATEFANWVRAGALNEAFCEANKDPVPPEK